ncbi:MAG: prolipoprotein diacylglyceryl transferase [Flavobacteriaceae bacterium]|nr:prolipoprotein diacylglyceryl transferase [Flavobacteriaceae bacterium]
MVVWDINPEIFNLSVFGMNIAPRYYGLAFVISFFIGERYCSKFMRDHGHSEKEISTLFTYSLLGTIIGARLGHCLFYEPGYYLTNPFEILKIWKGGLASHGGFIGVMAAVWLFNRKFKKKLELIWLLDLVAAPALLGGAFIRLGNLMNSEIVGTKTDVAWAFVFKQVDNIPRHPSQLYESLGYFVISLSLMYLYPKYHKIWQQGRFVGSVLVAGMSWRFFTEIFKENQVAFEQDMLFNMGQILSFMMILVGVYFLLRNKFSKKL